MQEIITEISSLESVDLKGLDKVSLQSRRDTKFIFAQSKLARVLQELNKSYYILEIDGNRNFTYENIYFDTAGYDLYLKHHNGKLNRYKVRKRKYVESNQVFLEVKFKTNKRRTEKSRLKGSQFNPEFDERDKKLILKSTPFQPAELSPSVNISFTRLTLAHKNFMDRATLDFNLIARWNDHEHAFQNLVIAEIKQDKFSVGSAFIKVMRALKIPEMRISKYCMSILHTRENMKYNRFKPRMLKLNRIANGNV